MERLGIGLIGTGFMGKCHALAWNAVKPVFGAGPKADLVALAEVDGALAAQKADEFGFAAATADWRDLVADPAIDVISITAPNTLHQEMAVAALEAGKHIWCEKPMAPTLAGAQAMRDAAAKSGKVAVLGYNYIQNPMIREMGRLIHAGEIGAVNHVRVEMDEDFMADPEAPFHWRNETASGYGALDDFAVHPLSLLRMLLGRVDVVMCDMGRPFPDRPDGKGGRRAMETHDIASVLIRLGDITGTLQVNRSAWGRKGRIAIQVFGTAGTIAYDQERANEFQIYTARGPLAEQGFRTILAAPGHPPYDRFIPAPGHGLGFNDLKIIECHELVNRILGKDSRTIDFDAGLDIERTVHAMAESYRTRSWVEVDQAPPAD
ncbi:MAG: Gfo/Idh/MocA family oxidoreductase [Rhodobiaceae bacterium]|nr:Gfo/Idh/MocA family oxidoreductase [Rhodobiaceae bacterium]